MARFRPSLRFSLRTMFVVVTAVALIIFGERLLERRSEFKGRAHVHAHAVNVPYTTGGPISATVQAVMEQQLEVYRSYHRQMRDKYEHAAMFPWLSVEPDLPAPPMFANLPADEADIEDRR